MKRKWFRQRNESLTINDHWHCDIWHSHHCIYAKRHAILFESESCLAGTCVPVACQCQILFFPLRLSSLSQALSLSQLLSVSHSCCHCHSRCQCHGGGGWVSPFLTLLWFLKVALQSRQLGPAYCQCPLSFFRSRTLEILTGQNHLTCYTYTVSQDMFVWQIFSQQSQSQSHFVVNHFVVRHAWYQALPFILNHSRLHRLFECEKRDGIFSWATGDPFLLEIPVDKFCRLGFWLEEITLRAFNQPVMLRASMN